MVGVIRCGETAEIGDVFVERLLAIQGKVGKRPVAVCWLRIRRKWMTPSPESTTDGASPGRIRGLIEEFHAYDHLDDT